MHNLLYNDKPKSHYLTYKNFEYQHWELEIEQAKTLIKIPLKVTKEQIKDKGAVDTPTILKEIRGYLSYDSSIKVRNENIPNSFNSTFTNVYDFAQENYCGYDSFHAFKENQAYFSQSYAPLKSVQNTYHSSYPSIASSTFSPYEEGTGEILTGRIKFFDSSQNYGFFVLDKDGSDLFVHYDNFLKAGITKEYIQMARAMNMRFAFHKINYYGKYKLSSKAVDIGVIQENYNRV